MKLGYKFGFINDRYIIRTHTSLRMACVLCCCINLCTIAGVGVDYYVFSGFVQLVRECLVRRMYNMIQKSDRDNHDNFVTLENSMNNMIPIGSRIFESFIGQK